MRVGHVLLGSGLLFTAWGVASWFLPFDRSDNFYTDTGYSIFYLVVGLLMAWSGVTWNPEIRRVWLRIFGVVFILLAIAGWAVSQRDQPNLWVTNLENPVDNVVHLVIGVVLFVAASVARSDEVYTEPPGTTMNVRRP